MRDIQGDKVSSTVNEYMKTRNFQENVDIKTEFSLLENLNISSEEELGIKSLISPSTRNSVSNVAASLPYQIIEQQYLRLKAWLTDAPEQYRSELSFFIFPFFVHLYFDLLHGAGKNSAKHFFNRHHQIFRFNREYDLAIRQMFTLINDNNNGANAAMTPAINSLKSSKHFARLSEKTLNYFLTFIHSNPNPSILHIFNNHFEIDVTNDDCSVTPMGGSRRSEDLSEGDEGAAASDTDCTQEELKQIKDIINHVNIMKPTMPSVCVYSVVNAFNGLSCAETNDESTLLACGFEDSVVKLWRLTAAPQSFALDAPKESPAGVQGVLSCDATRTEDTDMAAAIEKEDEEGAGGGRHVSGGEFCVLRGHKGPVFDVAFSHCSSHLFSVGEDATMHLWSLAEQRPVAFYRGHSYPVWCVATSAQSLYVATGSYDQTVRLWSTECTFPLRTLVGHVDSVDCVAFHPNCTYVASGSSDRQVRLWQVNDGAVARILCHHATPVKAVAFSPNGKYLASGSSNGEIALWDLAGGKVLCHLGASESSSSQTNAIASIGWSKDSRLIFAALSSGHLKGFSFEANDENGILSEAGSISCCSAICSGDLIHAKMNSHNYMAAVVAVHGER